MIVNPQLFNYRLLIGSLVIVITALSIYSMTNQQSIKAQQQLLEQENKLVEGELAQFIEHYDDVLISNKLISKALAHSKNATKLTLDSLNELRNDRPLSQNLTNIQTKNKVLFKNIDSLNQVNNKLQEENLQVYKDLQLKTLENATLIEDNKRLKERLRKSRLLAVNSLRAKTFEIVLGHKKESAKAKRIKTIEVCFVLEDNTQAEVSEKEIYVQVINPKNNVIADKGAINFGESTLIHSAKKIINTNNNVVDICLDVNADSGDIPLEAGIYDISIFHKDKKIGSTEVTLE